MLPSDFFGSSTEVTDKQESTSNQIIQAVIITIMVTKILNNYNNTEANYLTRRFRNDYSTLQKFDTIPGPIAEKTL